MWRGVKVWPVHVHILRRQSRGARDRAALRTGWNVLNRGHRCSPERGAGGLLFRCVLYSTAYKELMRATGGLVIGQVSHGMTKYAEWGEV